MIILRRVVSGVHAHFPARRSEWALGGMMFATGWILLMPEVTFNPRTPLFVVLGSVMSENTWGWTCLVFGFGRLGSLIINGTFSDTSYSRYSPHVRGGFAFLSCFFWATITIGLFAAWRPLFGLGCYPFLLLLEITNVWQAMRDARQADMSARDATAGD